MTTEEMLKTTIENLQRSIEYQESRIRISIETLVDATNEKKRCIDEKEKYQADIDILVKSR